MFNFFKYINDQQLQVKFTPLKEDEKIEIQVTDIRTNLSSSKTIPLSSFSCFKKRQALNKILDGIVSEIGKKKAEIYSREFSSHKRKELERFWRGE